MGSNSRSVKLEVRDSRAHQAPRPTIKSYGPNLGYDYGGRVLTAWLDR